MAHAQLIHDGPAPEQQQAAASHDAATDRTMTVKPTRVSQTLHFLQHFGEMVLAMMLGMGAFGLVNSALLVRSGFPYLSSSRFPENYALAMAVAMTVPMIAWMRIRKHTWRLTAEMAGAMVVPVIVLVAICSIGLLPGRFAVSGAHMLMVPAMLGAMLYRWHDYTCH